MVVIHLKEQTPRTRREVSSARGPIVSGSMKTSEPPAIWLPEWLTWVISVAPAVSLVLATFAGILAAISLGVAISGRNTARKSLGVAERAEARGAADIEIYLHRARQKPTIDGRAILLHVQVVNKSHSVIWIRRAALWVQYSLDSNLVRSEISSGELPAGVNPGIASPLELKPRQVVDGWLSFAVPGARTAGQPVVRQSLTLTDTDGQDWTLDDVKVGL